MRRSYWLSVGVLAAACASARTFAAPVWAEEPPAKKEAPKAKAPARVDGALPEAEVLRTLLVILESEPDAGEAPLKVEFAAEVYPGNDPVNPQFEWDFGDGSKRAKGAKLTHVYKTPGLYRAKVYAKDKTGRTGNTEDVVVVDAPEEEAKPEAVE